LEDSSHPSKIFDVFHVKVSEARMHPPSQFAAAFAILTLVACQQVAAQVSSPPHNQGDGKSEAHPATDRRWTLQQDQEGVDPPIRSAKTRDQRKKETLEALAAGDRRRGQQGDPKIDRGEISDVVTRPPSPGASGLQRAEK
jgi:hypothetical protein